MYLSVAPPVSSLGLVVGTPAWWPLEAYQSQARGRPRPVRRGASSWTEDSPSGASLALQQTYQAELNCLTNNSRITRGWRRGGRGV